MQNYEIISESLLNGQKQQAIKQFYALDESDRLDVIESIKEQGDLTLALLLLKNTHLS